MIFRARYSVGPAHVTVRLFVADDAGSTFANIGTLVMHKNDWIGFKVVLQRGRVLILDENNNPTG